MIASALIPNPQTFVAGVEGGIKEDAFTHSVRLRNDCCCLLSQHRVADVPADSGVCIAWLTPRGEQKAG